MYKEAKTARFDQVCRSLEGGTSVRVDSSDGESYYVVHVNPWKDPDEYICDCTGYLYRGHCRHQLVADEMICRWTSDDQNLKQTEDQMADMICPKCGGPTKWEVSDVTFG